jgi:TetR/AcrR family transcriptional regulator, cholesterol catabolism regulator
MAAQQAPSIEGTRAPGKRRAQLVSTAARLFSERGYHGTSMRHLGEAMGVLRGSLYAHIGSKQELLFDVVDHGADRFLERGEQATTLDGDAAERLEAFLVWHVETAIEHLEAATVFLSEWRYLDDDLRAIIRAKRDRYEAMARGIISDGIREGVFRGDVDVYMAARLVLSAGNWVYTWYRPGGGLTPTEIGEVFADMLVRGFQK